MLELMLNMPLTNRTPHPLAGWETHSVKERYAEWRVFQAFLDVYDKTYLCGRREETYVVELRCLTLRLLAEDVPAFCLSARVFAACMVGLVRLSLNLDMASRPDFIIGHFAKLARQTPYLLDDAVVHAWRGMEMLAMPGPGEFDIEQVQAMANAAGSKFCAKVHSDYMGRGWRVGCLFPALKRAHA